MDPLAASGWIEQKRGWEVRPERQRGQVLEGPGAGFRSGSQWQTRELKGWKLEDAGPLLLGGGT